MKFLKVLSTSAIAAAILASMSATAFADSDELDVDFDDAGFALDLEPFDDDDTFADFDNADLTGADDDDTFSVSLGDVKADTNTVADAQAPAADFAVDTADDDKDTFADLEEEEDDEYTAADADFYPGAGTTGFTGYYGRTYSWNYWDYSTKFWESTEFAPAGIPANATLFDVVNAAYDAGINSMNIQSLSNFLVLNEENFTSDDYAAFIATIYAIKEEIIDEHVAEVFPGATAGGLCEDDRLRLYTTLNRDERDAMSAAIINCANAHRVLISYDTDENGYPVIYASMRHRIADTPASSSTANTTVNTGSPVAATGGELPESNSTGAAAFASIALGLACVGAVIVARKNRERA
jgi:hypothetical protein